jgi:hypothetical protein
MLKKIDLETFIIEVFSRFKSINFRSQNVYPEKYKNLNEKIEYPDGSQLNLKRLYTEPIFLYRIPEAILIGPYGLMLDPFGRILSPLNSNRTRKLLKRTIRAMGAKDFLRVYLSVIFKKTPIKFSGVIHLLPAHGYGFYPVQANYCHWLLENLPQLHTFKDLICTGTRIAINDNYSSFQAQSLDLLGIKVSDCITLKRFSVMRCRDIYLATLCGANSQNSDRDPVRRRWLGDRLTSAVRTSGAVLPRIFLSRQGATRGSIRNFDQLRNELEKYDVACITPGERSFAEDLAVFKGARVLISSHGAALANMMFMSPGGLVIEIVGGSKGDADFFQLLAAEFELRYARLEATCHRDANNMVEEYEVDCDILGKLLENSI